MIILTIRAKVNEEVIDGMGRVKSVTVEGAEGLSFNSVLEIADEAIASYWGQYGKQTAQLNREAWRTLENKNSVEVKAVSLT